MMYAYSENYVLPITHDEVVHGKGSLLGKMPGDRWQQLANLRALPGVHVGPPRQAAAVHGQRVRPGRRSGASRAAWTGGCSTTGHHRGCSTLVRDLNRVYRDAPALWSRDIDPDGLRAGSTPTTRSSNVFSFLRYGRGRLGAGLRRQLLRPSRTRTTGSGCPSPGAWREVLNTDADATAAAGSGNLGAVEAVAQEWHGQPASAVLRVPPLGTLWLHRTN